MTSARGGAENERTSKSAADLPEMRADLHRATCLLPCGRHPNLPELRNKRGTGKHRCFHGGTGENPVCNAPKVPHVTALFALCGLSEHLPKNCPKSKPAPHRRTVRGLVGGCDFRRCLFHCTVFYHRKASLSSVRSTKYTAEISPYVLYI